MTDAKTRIFFTALAAFTKEGGESLAAQAHPLIEDAEVAQSMPISVVRTMFGGSLGAAKSAMVGATIDGILNHGEKIPSDFGLKLDELFLSLAKHLPQQELDRLLDTTVRQQGVDVEEAGSALRYIGAAHLANAVRGDGVTPFPRQS